MVALLVVILLACVAALVLLVIALCNIGSYKWMTKDDYAKLNDKAKVEYQKRKAEKEERKRRKKYDQEISGRITIDTVETKY